MQACTIGQRTSETEEDAIGVATVLDLRDERSTAKRDGLALGISIEAARIGKGGQDVQWTQLFIPGGAWTGCKRWQRRLSSRCASCAVRMREASEEVPQMRADAHRLVCI